MVTAVVGIALAAAGCSPPGEEAATGRGTPSNQKADPRPVASSDQQSPQQSDRVRLMLLWAPQTQFAGYYVALEKGFFSKRGLDVDILPGGPDRDPARYLEEGKTDFALLWLTSALAAADRGLPIVQVAQVFQSSHLAVVGWKERGVRTVRDLDGRRVGVWGGSFLPAFSAFFKSQGVAPLIVPQYYTVNLFLLKGVDACSVMDYNEYHALYQAGLDESQLSRFSLKDSGIDFPEDGVYCLRRLEESRPEASKGVAEAILEGWQYAAQHVEEAVDIVMARVRAANLPTNRTHMRRMLLTVIPSVFPRQGKDAVWTPGRLSRDSYEKTAKWLRELNVIRSVPAFEEVVR